MKNTPHFAQLFLRLALGIGFILPVMDRFGWLGSPGSPTVSWGSWSVFLDYTNTLMPFLVRPAANIMAIIATAGELVFAVLLIVGYKIKLAAIGSFLLTLLFALSMLVFANYRAPFNYSVFVVSASSLLLATLPSYKWGIEASK